MLAHSFPHSDGLRFLSFQRNTMTIKGLMKGLMKGLDERFSVRAGSSSACGQRFLR